MDIITANQELMVNQDLSVFLAGSVQSNVEIAWRDTLIKKMKGYKVTLLDPRTDKYGSNHDSTAFKNQVNWELEALEQVDIIIMYLDEASKSPISLLELGLYAQSGKLIVCCSDGFWKKGNVQMVCDRYGVHQVEHVDDLVNEIQNRIQ